MSKKHEVRKQGGDVLVAAQREEYWSAPIPSPEAMARYNEVMPGAVDRILAMAEREAASRHSNDASILANERLKIESAKSEVMRGQVFAFIFIISCVGVAAWCAHVGQPWVAALFGGGTIAQIVIAMLNAKPRQ